jgi:hypothetical protein
VVKLFVMNQALESLLNDLASDIKPEVFKIESGLETTRNHYGEYMQILSKFEGNKRILISLALLRANANYQGMQDALKILNG